MLKKLLFALPSGIRFKLMRALHSKASNSEKAELGQQNLINALNNVQKLGFNPSYVIDIGAHNGS